MKRISDVVKRAGVVTSISPGLIGKPRPTRYTFCGDSISNTTAYGSGFDAASVGDLYVSRLVAAHPELTATNFHSQPNGRLMDYWASTQLLNTARDSRDLVTILPLFNDMRQIGCAPQNIGEYGRMLDALLIACALPESSIVRTVLAGTTTPNAAQVTTTGSWNGGAFGQYSLTNGATMSAKVNGSTIGLLFFRGMNNGGSSYNGNWSVSVDGVERTKGSTFMNLSMTSEKVLSAIVVDDLDPGDHTILITKLDTGLFWSGFFFGFEAANVAGAHVICGTCLTMPAGGYAVASNTANDPAVTSDAPSWLKGDGGVSAINSQIKQSCDRVRSYGLSIHYLDVTSGYMPVVHTSGDSIHPGKGGHGHLFSRFNAAIRQHNQNRL